MSDLLPKLVAFIFCLIVCVVGLYLQKQEQKQEEQQERQKQQDLDRWKNEFVRKAASVSSATAAMEPSQKQQSGLSSWQDQQQGGQQKRGEGYLQ